MDTPDALPLPVNPAALPPGARAVAYLRVSTERQASEDRTSLADPARAALALAARLGVPLAAWYRDEGASGATVAQRPAFRAMLAACAAAPRPVRAPAYVLCLNDSRFGRFPNPDQAAALRFELESRGWRVRFAESDEVEDPTFRSVIRALGSAQASEYRRVLQRNTRRGMRGSAEQGYWTRRAPFGYRRAVVHPPEAARVLMDGQNKATNERVKLAPHEHDAALVQWAFAAYAAGGVTLGDVGRRLAAAYPARPWSRQHVHDILTNAAYVGDVVGGLRPNCDGRRELGDAYGCPDAHPPLVSRAVFAAVAARLAENARKPRHATTPYLLTGLVACAVCGRGLVGGGNSHRANGRRSSFYRCGAPDTPFTVRANACPGPIGCIARPRLEAAVLDTLAATVGAADVRRRLAAAVDRTLARLATAPDPTPDVHAAQAAAEARRARLVAAVADGTLTRAEAAGPLAAVRADLAACAARLAEAKAHVGIGAVRADELRAARARILAAAADFPAAVAQAVAAGHAHVVRALIRPWLAAATFDKRTRALELHIRRLPALAGLPDVLLHAPLHFPLSDSRARVGQQHTAPTDPSAARALVRTVDLDTPALRGVREARARRAAGG